MRFINQVATNDDSPDPTAQSHYTFMYRVFFIGSHVQKEERNRGTRHTWNRVAGFPNVAYFSFPASAL
jgi:hypothetical protein